MIGTGESNEGSDMVASGDEDGPEKTIGLLLFVSFDKEGADDIEAETEGEVDESGDITLVCDGVL